MDRTLFALVTLALVLSPSALGTTLRVPAQQPTIQAAVDAASDGDVIVISKGTYVENVTITDGQDLVLKGKGKVTIDANGGAHAIALENCDGIRLQNIRVKNAAMSGIFVNGGVGHRLKKCRGLAGAAPAIETVDAEATTLDRCKVDGSTVDGIVVDGEACHLTGIKVVSAVGNGIVLRGPRHLLEKSRVESSGVGVLVQDGTQSSSGCVVIGNALADCLTAGIAFECERSVIRENKIFDAGSSGISVNGSGSENLIEENQISSPIGRGMSILGGRNTIVRNLVNGAGTDGIGLIGPESSGNLVYMNDCMNCANNGYLMQGDGNSLIANDSSGNGTDFTNFGSEPTNLTLANVFDPPQAAGTVIHVPADQTTIAAAIAAAGIGDVIELAPDTYAEAVDLTGKSDLTIRGTGVGGDAIIDHASGITLFGSPRVLLQQLVVRNATGTAISIGSSDTVSLDRVRVEDGATSSLTATASKRIRIVDCSFADAVSLDAQAAFVDGCSIDGADTGFSLFGRHVVINAATLQDITGIGIRIGQPAPSSFGILVDGSTLATIGQDAIHVFSSTSSIVLRDNAIGPTPANGIDLDSNVQGVMISHNAFTDCALNGVIALDEENVLLGNSAKRGGNGFRTLGVDASGNALIGNRTKKVMDTGFSIEGSRNATIGNRTKKSGVAPYVDNNPAGENLALDNLFKS